MSTKEIEINHDMFDATDGEWTAVGFAVTYKGHRLEVHVIDVDESDTNTPSNECVELTTVLYGSLKSVDS